MVVHTDDAHGWTNGVCTFFDEWVPYPCPDLNTTTYVDVNTPALIWFIAAFPDAANPGVTVCYFGHDHSMPQYYHNRWGYCGPAGTIEVPDTGWPDTPTTAGNSVAFGSPIVGDHLFPFYYFDVWGEPGWYYCTAINPVGGYAGYVDDSNPPELDEIDLFGCVYYHQTGYNNCPSEGPLPGACCFENGDCILTMDVDECLGLGGYDWLGEGTLCDPNPCPQPGACCFNDGSCAYTLEDICYQASGELWIAGTDCDPNPCPQPPEACCYEDGSCGMLPPDECIADGGTPWGAGTYCDPNPCPQPPTGACCAPDGSCIEVTEAQCGEELWIEGEVCDPNPCPQPPTGACCYGCWECAVLTQAECEDLPDDYGWFEGEGCEPNPCPPTATETTTWGSIKADYK